MNFTSKIERRSTCRPRDCIFIYLTMCGCIGRSSPTVRSPWHIPICCGCVAPYNRNRHPPPPHTRKPNPFLYPSSLFSLSLTHSLTHFTRFRLQISSCFQELDRRLPRLQPSFATTPHFTIPFRPPFTKLFYLDAMGLCISSEEREERAHSQRIDKAIEEDSKRLKRECKLLLLGKEQPLIPATNNSIIII